MKTALSGANGIQLFLGQGDDKVHSLFGVVLFVVQNDGDLGEGMTS